MELGIEVKCRDWHCSLVEPPFPVDFVNKVQYWNQITEMDQGAIVDAQHGDIWTGAQDDCQDSPVQHWSLVKVKCLDMFLLGKNLNNCEEENHILDNYLEAILKLILTEKLQVCRCVNQRWLKYIVVGQRSKLVYLPNFFETPDGLDRA